MNNSTAIGYMIIAAKQAGLDLEKIQEMERLMYKAMDEKPEHEAYEEYMKF